MQKPGLAKTGRNYEFSLLSWIGSRRSWSRSRSYAAAAVLAQRGDKWGRFRGRLHIAIQDSAERHHASVEGTGIVFALGDHCPIERDAGKHTTSAGVGKDFGAHLPVGRPFRMTSDRTSRYRTIGTELELARQQMLHAVVVHDDHHKVNGFPADLQAEATALHGEECRSAPTLFGVAAGNALAI